MVKLNLNLSIKLDVSIIVGMFIYLPALIHQIKQAQFVWAVTYLLRIEFHVRGSARMDTLTTVSNGVMRIFSRPGWIVEDTNSTVFV